MNIPAGHHCFRLPHTHHSHVAAHKHEKKMPETDIPKAKPPENAEETSPGPTISSTSARNVALGVVVDPRNEAPQEEPRISDVVNHAEIMDSEGEPVVVSEAMEKVVVGMKVSEVAGTGLGVGLEYAHLLPSEKSIPCGLQIVTQSFETIGLCSKIPDYQNRNIALNDLNEKLLQLQKKQETLDEGSEEFTEINIQIKTLQSEVQDLNYLQANFEKEAVTLAFRAPISEVKAASEIGLAVAQTGSHAAHVLLVVNPITTLAGAVNSGVSSAVGLKNNLNLNEKLSSEFMALDELRQSKEKGSIERVIIEAKMHQLEQQIDDVCASMMRNFTTIISSKLGTAGSIGAIVGLKVTLGVIGGSLVAASGIGAAVLLGVAGAGAAAYAIYKNKEAISSTLEEAKIAIETPIQNIRQERVESEKAIAQANLEEAKNFQNQNATRERKFKSYTNDVIAQIDNLVSDKLEIEKQIDALQPQEGASIFERMKAAIEIYSKKNDIQKINEQLEERKDQLREIWDVEEKKRVKYQKQEQHSSSELEMKAKESEEIAKRKEHLASESQRLAEEERYIKIALKMNDMTWQDVQKFHKNMEQRFENEPASKEAAKEFLASQHYSLEGFDKDPASVVLEYVSKEMTV